MLVWRDNGPPQKLQSRACSHGWPHTNAYLGAKKLQNLGELGDTLHLGSDCALSPSDLLYGCRELSGGGSGIGGESQDKGTGQQSTPFVSPGVENAVQPETRLVIHR